MGDSPSTFNLRPPLLDTSQSTFIDIWDHHRISSPTHAVFHYQNDQNDPTSAVNRITWKECSLAMHIAGRIVIEAMKERDCFYPFPESNAPPVVAVFAVTDIITAYATITGIMRAGMTALLLSPRNSPSALAHLLTAADCRMIVCSRDKFISDSLSETLNHVRESGGPDIPLFDLPSFDDTFGKISEGVQLLDRPSWVNPDTVAFISHTSGTTSFPKPRFITHKTFMQVCMNFHNEKVDVTGKILAGHSVPHFHNMGAITSMGWTALCGITFAAFPPTVPPIVPNPQRVIEAAASSESDILFVVPSFIEAWSSQEDAVKTLTKIKFVWFAGGPLDKRIGDKLVSKGVNLRTLYGATELGCVSALAPDIPKEDWEYFKIAKQLDVKFVREDGTEGMFELVAFDSPGHTPCAFNYELDGRPAFAIGDLLSPHPSLPDVWKIVGRTDDQIMHSNGEKTNPGPMERLICKHPLVSRAMMFGREQFHPGVIVEPVEDRKIDLLDKKAVEAFMDEIWPFVEEANSIAPSHSRIFKEMVFIADPNRPFKVTPKQTLRRSEITKEYSQDILAAYRSFQLSGPIDISIPTSWTRDNVVEFVHITVKKVLGRPLDWDSDFFQYGLDSLQVAYLTRSYSGALQQAGFTMPFEASIIYDNPTANSLGEYVFRLISGQVSKPKTSAATAHAEEMSSLVAKYTEGFPIHKGALPMPEGETVLVTGTTGSLGAHVLKALVSLNSVRHVYALNRPGGTKSKDIRSRQKTAINLQGIDSSIMSSTKITLLEGELQAVNLGLSDSVIQGLRSNVTSIIHLAWKVDFNHSLKSFIPQIRGVHALIDLALSSELADVPNLIFASSISDLQNFSGEVIVKAAVSADPVTAVGMGYGESKWVASRILQIARERTPLRSIVVRIGQLCGDSHSGSWNPWEWFPSIIRSGKAVGCLPELKGELTWIPVDMAASILADLRKAGSEVGVVNLVHPHPTPCEDIMQPIQRALGLSIVPYNEWLNRLESASERNAEDVPALRLLNFYKSFGSASNIEMGIGGVTGLRLDVNETLSLSETLSSLKLYPLQDQDVARWLKKWSLTD